MKRLKPMLGKPFDPGSLSPPLRRLYDRVRLRARKMQTAKLHAARLKKLAARLSQEPPAQNPASLPLAPPSQESSSDLPPLADQAAQDSQPDADEKQP